MSADLAENVTEKVLTEVSAPSIEDSTNIRELEETENTSAKMDSNTVVFQSIFKKGKDLSESVTKIPKHSNETNSTDVSEIGDGV